MRDTSGSERCKTNGSCLGLPAGWDCVVESLVIGRKQLLGNSVKLLKYTEWGMQAMSLLRAAPARCQEQLGRLGRTQPFGVGNELLWL